MTENLSPHCLESRRLRALIAVFDSASHDLAQRTTRSLQSCGFEVEWVVHHFDDDYESEIQATADRMAVIAYTPTVGETVSANQWYRRWFKSPGRAGWRGLALSAAFFLPLLLRGVLLRTGLANKRLWPRFSDLAHHVFRLLETDALLRRLLDDARPDVVILHHDFIEQFTPSLARLSRRRGIPVVMRPALIPDPDLLLKLLSRREENILRGRFQRIASRFFPNWFRDYQFRQILRLPIAHILALKLVGLKRRDPWMHHSGEYDVISVSDMHAWSKYRSLGIDEARIAVHIEGDDEFAAYPPSGKDQELRIVATIPPDQLTGSNHFSKFQSYDALIDSFEDWISRLAAVFRVELAPHPKEPETRYDCLKRRGWNIVEGSTRDAMKNAHGLFSYVGSATQYWGHQIGRPIICWNPFSYDAPGDVVVETDPEAIVSRFSTLIDEFASQQAQLPADSAERITFSDGIALVLRAESR